MHTVSEIEYDTPLTGQIQSVKSGDLKKSCCSAAKKSSCSAAVEPNTDSPGLSPIR